ncbi:MAG: pyruvate kinase [Candidatus Melainabacteria bacterium RIFOXYA12_FULL_32_12]|nr:MAG: pyruvate kinase [Candidatus Melainabacteria bacterium RIFOXYA2_FULL_32_9]OGI29182.1 MAG: pyruvate kinase [Candidatus Melainabacteria bacterium RIFOXYA12_FULL_32_12]
MEYSTRTKIIATIGPASNTEDKINDLIKAGTKVFRINSSHGTKEEHASSIEIIRKVSKSLDEYIAIILDLQGPKIRVGNLKEPIELKDNQEITIIPSMETDKLDVIPVDYPGIVNDVKKNDRILLDDGKIHLKVLSTSIDSIKANVIHGGTLISRKGVNIPEESINLPAITDKDIDYIKFGIEHDVDYFALSFVRSKADITTAKDYIHKFGGDIPVIAKIEKPQALDNLEDIISASDGIMVARGDLGIEISPEYVPLVQKRLICTANCRRKAVITATQMLESMITQLTPTRAEASDVANAILDGSDAIMLSGETAIGKYPVETVNMMSSIAKDTEKSNIYKHNVSLWGQGEVYEVESQAIATAVVRMLSEIEISAIIAFTRSGFTGRLLSKEKPSVPIIALSDNEKICRRLNLFWGVFPYKMDFGKSFTEETLKNLDKMLIKETFLNAGDKVIITGGLPYLAAGKTNFIRLHQIGAAGIMY